MLNKSNNMKISKFVIISLFIGLTGFSISSTFDFNNPSVTIISENIEESDAGKVIVISINLCSSANLERFSITPNIKGLNEDSELEYVFNSVTKQALVNYYYSVPSDVSKVNFIMTITDTDGKTEKYNEVEIK